MAHPFGEVAGYAAVVNATVVVDGPADAARVLANFQIFLLEQRLHGLEVERFGLEAEAETLRRKGHSALDTVRGPQNVERVFLIIGKYAQIFAELVTLANEIREFRQQIANARALIRSCDRCADRDICGYPRGWCPWASGVTSPWPQHKHPCSGRCSKGYTHC